MVKREEIRVGDYLVNNDPRKVGTKVKVDALVQYGEDWYALYKAGYRIAKVRLDRISKMGEKGKLNGWTLAGSTE